MNGTYEVYTKENSDRSKESVALKNKKGAQENRSLKNNIQEHNQYHFILTQFMVSYHGQISPFLINSCNDLIMTLIKIPE